MDPDELLLVVSTEAAAGLLQVLHAGGQELLPLAQVGGVEDVDGLHRHVRAAGLQGDPPDLGFGLGL